MHRARGIAFMCAAALAFTMVDALVKWLSVRYPTTELVFFRGLFAFIPILALVARGGGVSAIYTRRPLAHMLRSTFALVAMLASFFAFSHMPLADVIAIGFSAPLFVTGLSVLLLGEKVGIRRWSAVLIGFVGVLIMVRPGSAIGWPAWAALLAALCIAGSAIVIRTMSDTERSVTIVFYNTLTVMAVGAVTLPFAWATPALADWPALVALGICGGVGQLCLTESYRSAPVSVVVPFNYSAILWATLFGFAIWGDVPDLPLIVGAALVIGSVLYLLHRESIVKRNPRPS
jgi:drug/metabolite transporter (DMT)-like permease